MSKHIVIIGGGVIGLDVVSGLPRITEALRKAGYSDADIGKIWSGNLLRVMAAAQAEGARELSADDRPAP